MSPDIAVNVGRWFLRWDKGEIFQVTAQQAYTRDIDVAGSHDTQPHRSGCRGCGCLLAGFCLDCSCASARTAADPTQCRAGRSTLSAMAPGGAHGACRAQYVRTASQTSNLPLR
jgi:hypothetical protein